MSAWLAESTISYSPTWRVLSVGVRDYLDDIFPRPVILIIILALVYTLLGGAPQAATIGGRSNLLGPGSPPRKFRFRNRQCTKTCWNVPTHIMELTRVDTCRHISVVCFYLFFIVCIQLKILRAVCSNRSLQDSQYAVLIPGAPLSRGRLSCP